MPLILRLTNLRNGQNTLRASAADKSESSVGSMPGNASKGVVEPPNRWDIVISAASDAGCPALPATVELLTANTSPISGNDVGRIATSRFWNAEAGAAVERLFAFHYVL